MSRLLTAAALVAALALFAAPAASAAQVVTVPSGFVLYPSEVTVPPATLGVTGRVTSPRAKCLDDRVLKLVRRAGGVKRSWDVARSSREGAVGFLGSYSELIESNRIVVKIAKRVIEPRKGPKVICGPGELELRGGRVSGVAPTLAGGPAPRAPRAASRSAVQVLGPGSTGSDLVLMGSVESGKARCVSGRGVALFGRFADRLIKLDTGRTGRAGGWAGHVSVSEYQLASDYVAVLRKKTYRQRGKKKVCGSSRDGFELELLREGRRAW